MLCSIWGPLGQFVACFLCNGVAGIWRSQVRKRRFSIDRRLGLLIQILCAFTCGWGTQAALKNKGKGRPTVRSYRCEHYAQCAVRALCSGRRDGRRIELSPQRAAVMRQREKRRDPAMRAMLQRRKAIIEPVFATLKQAMGFRRWTVRGLENVRTQWALLCAALNLKKMYKYWAAGQFTPA